MNIIVTKCVVNFELGNCQLHHRIGCFRFNRSNHNIKIPAAILLYSSYITLKYIYTIIPRHAGISKKNSDNQNSNDSNRNNNDNIK